MAKKRRGKVDRELIRRELARAKQETIEEFSTTGALSPASDGSDSKGHGACFITVRGRTGCDIEVSKAACEAAAARLGGIPTWVENGSCD